jgi:O-antigen/teichoic acid export membrane protein
MLQPFFKRIEASDIGIRLARGVFWSMAGAMISRGLMLVATVAVARLLGKTGYGELGMIQSTVGMFGVFAGFGLGLTATKHVAELRQSDPIRAGRILGALDG